MTHVVTDACVRCKYTTCVEVCPVDCFYEGALMLVINPLECIDCGVCIPECPIDAIKEEDATLIEWVERAQNFVNQGWPNITKTKLPLSEAERYKNEKDKFKKYMQDL